MDVRGALKSQYHGALAMLRQAIERCPDDLWMAGDHPRQFWRMAYHALFYAHFYLEPNQDTFQRWERHREDAFMPEIPPGRQLADIEPYSKKDLLDYWDVCDSLIDKGVDRLDLSATECGFPWYRMPKLEHQMMNVRHIQQHVGQLAERLVGAGADPDWVGQAP